MAKRKTYEDILDTDFRWPTAGDQAFVAADDPFDNVNIVEDGFIRLVLMMDGYKQAGDLMVERAANDRAERAVTGIPNYFQLSAILGVVVEVSAGNIWADSRY